MFSELPPCVFFQDIGIANINHIQIATDDVNETRFLILPTFFDLYIQVICRILQLVVMRNM